MLRLNFLLPALLFFSESTVGISDHRKLLRKDVSSDDATGAVPVYNFSMPIDHFSPNDTRTYHNRYFINDTYYQPGGPVFFYDFGEAGVLPSSAAAFLAETDGPTVMMQLAQRYKGLVIGWEHRYYGESQPFPETIIGESGVVNGTKDTWQYLTQEQSLQDIAYFATHFCPEGYTEDESAALHPSQTPWIWIGGSYPGSRGAWIRIRNPEIIYAVWSSSAPVQAQADGSPYFHPIETSLPANCSADVKAVVDYADRILSGKEGETAYTQLQDLVYVASETAQNGLNTTLNAADAALYDEASIAELLSRALWTNFQYGGPSRTTHVFCNAMQSYDPMAFTTVPNDTLKTALSVMRNPGNASYTEDGIAKTYGVNAAIQAYLYATRRHLGSFLVSSSPDTDSQTWGYQFLTEFGWFQGSRPDNITILSKFDNYTYVQESSIEWYFGDQPEIIPSEPDVNHTLTKYGGWEMSPSNVMFTNGEDDPWRTFSVMSQDHHLGAPVRSIVQAVPACNQPPSGTDVFGLLYPGQVHVPDFFGTPESDDFSTSPFTVGLDLFSSALDAWLPCFEARSGK